MSKKQPSSSNPSDDLTKGTGQADKPAIETGAGAGEGDGTDDQGTKPPTPPSTNTAQKSPASPTINDIDINHISTNPALMPKVSDNVWQVQGPIQEESQATDVLDDETARKIVKSYAEKHHLTIRDALAIIAKLVQQGGANASKPNLVVTWQSERFEINELRSIVKYHDKKGTVRKLAKSIRHIINKISVINSWPGPLYKDISRSNPELKISSVDAVYCNEINADNYDSDVPPLIREALQRREQRVREERNKEITLHKKRTGQNKNRNKKRRF